MTIGAELPTQDIPDEGRKPSRQGQGGGPKTSFGKAASSQNATTHGLAVRFRLPNHFQRGVDERMTAYVPRYQPRDDDDDFLCAQAAIGYTRNRHALGEASTYLRIRSERAQLYWDLDRGVDAALLGARLSRRPSVIAPQLAATLHGARWMLERWELLRELLLMEGAGLWLEDAVSTAYDLLGIDPVFRESDPKRLARGTTEERLAVLDAEVERLRGLTAGAYREHDIEQKLLAIRGEAYMNDPNYRRLMRYAREGELLNERCLKELERRRIARDLPAYNPDGSLCHPIDPPGTPPRPAPEPLADHQVVFFHPVNGAMTAQALRESAEQAPPASPESEGERPSPRPTPPPSPEPARPRLSPEEVRRKANEARLKQEADRRQAREEKARKRAERKAIKAAKARGRDR